jgi:phosphate-selective porin OprO/OprP
MRQPSGNGCFQPYLKSPDRRRCVWLASIGVVVEDAAGEPGSHAYFKKQTEIQTKPARNKPTLEPRCRPYDGLFDGEDMSSGCRSALLVSCAVIGLSSPSWAQSAAPTDTRVDQLENQLNDLQQQLAELRNGQGGSAQPQTSNAADEQGRQTTVSVNNARLTVASTDGRFSAVLRGLLQYDTAYYMQDHSANLLPSSYGNNFSTGSNFRRVYLGLSGTAFGDWSYNLNFDFGGSGGTETPGHIQSVYIEYDGLAPWTLRMGAYPPPANIEDATAAADTLFLERNSPSDLQRNLAGGDGRDAVSVIYANSTVYGAFSYTGDKVQDGAKALAAAGATASPTYDEQEGLVGRLSWLPISRGNANLLVGLNGTYIIRPPDAVANGLANLSNTPGATAINTITLSDPPELTVDSNGYTLANTTALSARHLTQWGVETAGNWDSLFGQAGYYNFDVDRAPVAFATTSGAQTVTPSNDNFSGWYAQSSWILTGEERLYNPATGAFSAPRVVDPFGFGSGGSGAFELAMRYSDLNLNSHINNASYVTVANASGSPAGTHTYDFYNTVRGGDQRILTFGLNWYPNTVVRFTLNYEWIENSRLQSGSSPNALTGLTQATTGAPVLPSINGGQNMSVVALRAQLAL